MQRAGPSRGIKTMIQDLLGRAGDQEEFIYLSDGGHFDNLGLHEMLRRRCSKIVVVDADEDPNFGYEDLRRTSQHALVNLGVRVDFVEPLQFSNKDNPGETKLRLYGAYATIHYPEGPPDAPPGELILLKPWLPDDCPAELKAFKVLKKDFPHDPTANQFFTESDFESYRRRGEFLADKVMKVACGPYHPGSGLALDTLMAGVRRLATGKSGKDQVRPAPVPASRLYRRVVRVNETAL